jgi:hypothetical protein
VSRCIAIVAALSVLWHTTAGCCAHHNHFESTEHAAVEAEGACEHDHHGCDPVNPSRDGSPDSRPCHDAPCAFAVPDAPLSIEFDAPGNGFFLSDGLLHDQTLLGLSEYPGALVNAAPLISSTLPRHLALGVLLL